MVEVRFTDPAYDDLADIEAYISQNSPANARALINKIVDRVTVLETFPEVGRVVPEYQNPTIRQLLEGSYRIIYRIKSEELIEIIRVIHGKRRLEA